MESRLTNRLAKKLFFKSLEKLRHGSVEIVCPEQTYSFGDPASEDPLCAMLLVHGEAFFRKALFGGDVALGECYMQGGWSSPDLVAVARLAIRNMSLLEEEHSLLSSLTRLANHAQHLLRNNDLRGSRKNIAFHYDLGNDFYRLFLDPTLAYSCAYFLSEEDTLEQAQRQKFDVICRKLKLSPEDHLLEIGSGWGGFALHAASRYGCKVSTTTISREQYDYVAALLKARPELAGRVELLFEDYRKLAGRYDKLVSIEMFEAVGYDHWDDYFAACNRLLKDDGDGLFLLQTITMNEARFPEYRRSCDWIQKHVFPGSLLACQSEVLRSVARTSKSMMQLTHAEEIGPHYVRTLQAWRRAFHEKVAAVRAMDFDEPFCRMWDYYLAYCEAAFTERYIGDCQLLFAKDLVPQKRIQQPWAARRLAASY